MSGKRGEQLTPIPGDASDPDGFPAHVARYLEAMQVKHYARSTVHAHAEYLAWFAQWCAARSLTQPKQITKPILERYQRHLYYYRKANGEPLSFASQHMRLSCLRVFFRWLTRQNYLLYNPASDLELPRLRKNLPRHILHADEVEQLMAHCDLQNPFGVRDRAMLETLYSTGMRRSELVKLKLFDIDAQRQTVFIHQGKGHKDRVVPLGERALAWLQRYVHDIRPQFVMEPDAGYVFLTQEGDYVAPHTLSQNVRGYLKAANIDKPGSTHLFRHSMATLMLENGADIRFIQAILGHSELSTTQIYTQVSIKKLQEVHALTHPGSRLRARALTQLDHSTATANADDLLAALEVEADADET
jgi:integrase/recombinase XerD